MTTNLPYESTRPLWALSACGWIQGQKTAATLEAFLAQFKLPVLTYLRDSQVYVNAAFNGLSAFDLPEYVSARDLEQWQPLLDWLEED